MSTTTSSAERHPHLVVAPKPAPVAPGALPGIGHLPALRRDPIRFAHFAFRSCGEVVEIKIPFKRAFLFTGPKAHEFVLGASDDVWSMSDVFKFVLPSFFGPKFKHDEKIDFPYAHTKIFNPILVEKKMKQHAVTIHDEVQRLVADLDGDVDIYDFAKKLFLRTAAKSFFGSGITAAQLDSFTGFYSEMANALTVPSMIAGRLGLRTFTRAEGARRKIVSMLGDAIATRQGRPEVDGDLLDVMLTAQHPTGRKQTLDEIVGNCLQLLFAAQTPTAVAFAWTGVELARHPEWQRRAQSEVDTVWQDFESGVPSYADVRKLRALDWSVQETLRLHSPAAFHARISRVDQDFHGYKIPKGSVGLIAPEVSHSLSTYFPAPHRFDPSRFAPERSERKMHPLAIVTFGGGPHRCIGTAFAMLQLNLAWAHVLRHFDIDLIDDVRPKYAGLLMMPSQPCRMRLKRRPKV